MSCNYEAYMAKDCKSTQSYLITLIDGTGSMSGEYETIVDAHNATFSCLGSQQMRYQWEQQLYDFLPFRSAGSGNITETFKTIFQKLLNSYYQNNITIVFISDGQESFDFNQLTYLIEQMKQKYLIQFISVAVGNSFPNTISNVLRKAIHNQNSSCPAIFEVQRRSTSQQQLQQEFTTIFHQIKQLLNVQSKLLQVNQPVYQTIASKETTTMVAPGESYLNKTDGTNKKMVLDGEEIQPTYNPHHISQLICNSISQEIIESAATKNQNSQQNFKRIKVISDQLLTKMEASNDNKDQEALQLMDPLLELIDKFADGTLKAQNLSESTMTMLQKHLKQKQEISKFIECFAKEKVEENLTKEKVKEKLQNKLNKTKLGCYVRSTITKKPLNLVQSIWQVVTQSLDDLKQVIEKEQNQEIKVLLIEFKNIIDEQLEKIFKQQKFENLEERNQFILTKLNEFLRRITILSSQSTFIKSEFINIVDYCRSFDVEKFDLEAETQKNQEVNQYSYLPKCIQPKIQNNNVRASYVATYALLLLGGNKSPSLNDVAYVLKQADIEPNLPEIEALIKNLKGKDLNQVIKEGKLKMPQLMC
ncbi:unnamed protein product [Paramecium octaurelia]|uniref:VWFA domain-containing protein n=1 Tax=Paramecium octaurelia TaxID=43137 RepID=A0A8S1YMI4_PAROT|nr:unnamed protein product [Paramecium octaurelia]CAD8215109.1 unnamed protein product [Paramecium octaurelia]CAD8215110.1 unnamed protein product [Paramecium octaurelia]